MTSGATGETSSSSMATTRTTQREQQHGQQIADSTSNNVPTATNNANNRTVEVKMSLYWDEWSRCIGSTYQKDHLYRLGHLDSCSRQWKDVKLAAKAKFLEYKNPQEVQKILQSTYYHKRTTISPTLGAIWEKKEQPGWD